MAVRHLVPPIVSLTSPTRAYNLAIGSAAREIERGCDMESPYQEDPIARTTKPFMAPGKTNAEERRKRPLGIVLLTLLMGWWAIQQLIDIWSIINDFPAGDGVWTILELTLSLGLSVLFFITAWGLWLVESPAIKLARWIFRVFTAMFVFMLLAKVFWRPESAIDLQSTVFGLLFCSGILFYLYRERIKELL